MNQRLMTFIVMAGGALSSGVAFAHHEAFKASDVIGKTLHDPRGEAIGEVEDLVIENDEVLNAIVSVGGTLGVGEKVVAVPARELQYVHENDTWQIQMTKAQLEALPKFDADAVLKKTEVATRDRPLR
jgi:sporulation protein YlmC with PRC-barrel domain